MVIKMRENIIKGKWSYIFLFPWFILFSIFIVYPFISGFMISLNDYSYNNSNFIFLNNYIEIFKDELFIKSISTTFILAIIVMPSVLFLALWISYTINNMHEKFQYFLKIFFYIPVVSSSVALVISIKWIFNPNFGLSIYITNLLGVEAINWYGDGRFAIMLISYLVILVSVGVPIILFTTAMDGMPKNIYEAAEIDGATAWQKFVRITIPLLKPTILYVSIMQTIASFQIFEYPLLLTGGGPYYKTTTVMLLLYRTAFGFGKLGAAAAMGFVLFIFIMIFSFIQLRLFRSDIQY